MKIEINNWDKYNPRKDVKSSSWFRLENSFLQDMFSLNSDAKCVFIALMSSASAKNKSCVSVNRDLIAALLCIAPDSVKSALDKLCELKLISDVTDTNVDGNAIPVSSPYGRTDGRTDERTTTSASAEGDSQQEAKLTPRQLADIWNANKGDLPEVKRLGGKRERSARARLKENSDPEFWKAIVTMAATTPFFTGRNDRKWVANFDWLLRESTLNNALEGNYSRQQKPSAEKPYHKLSPQEKNARMLARMRAEEEELAQRRKQEGLDDSPN
jgi:hypothetical protein